MKQFVIKLLLFIICIVAVDRAFGAMLAYMADHARGGYLAHQNYIVNKSVDDILVFGSSRAIHHYDTPFMRDSLGLKCYNCGQDGEGIILFYGWWQFIKKRHRPDLIIYEINPDYDTGVGDNTKHLGWLKGLYADPDIQREFDEVDPLEKYKMLSMMYRYNSRFHQIVIDYFRPVHNIDLGFLPVDEALDPLRVRDVDEVTASVPDSVGPLDSLKLKYLSEIINDVGPEHFVFVYSPTWYGIHYPSLDAVSEFAREHGVRFIDFSTSPKFSRHNEYFYDGYHMNAHGAREFTRDLMNELGAIGKP